MVITPVEISEPIAMDKNEYFKLRLVNPAIKLPDQMPVKGNGTDTKPASAKYFLKFDPFCSIVKLLFA